MKVSIMESLGISQAELEQRMAPFKAEGVEFNVFEKTTDKALLVEQAKGSDALIIANMPFPNEVVAACEGLKFIDVAFTGVDHVGLDAAKEKGIAVSNASGYSNEAVAELALGMVLSIYRNMREVEARCREGKTKDGLVGNEIKGKTIGIIGFGKIGRRSGELFNAFGTKILAYDVVELKNVPDYVTQVDMDTLLAESDIILLHCPLMASTKGMIDAAKFDKMKKTAVFINVARGPIVNTMDLANALKKGKIAAAGVDVFDAEPPLALTEPLLNAPNLLVTPHVAFASKESMSLRAEIIFDNLRAWMDGKQQNVIL